LKQLVASDHEFLIQEIKRLRDDGPNGPQPPKSYEDFDYDGLLDVFNVEPNVRFEQTKKLWTDNLVRLFQTPNEYFRRKISSKYDAIEEKPAPLATYEVQVIGDRNWKNYVYVWVNYVHDGDSMLQVLYSGKGAHGRIESEMRKSSNVIKTNGCGRLVGVTLDENLNSTVILGERKSDEEAIADEAVLILFLFLSGHQLFNYECHHMGEGKDWTPIAREQWSEKMKQNNIDNPEIGVKISTSLKQQYQRHPEWRMKIGNFHAQRLENPEELRKQTESVKKALAERPFRELKEGDVTCPKCGRPFAASSYQALEHHIRGCEHEKEEYSEEELKLIGKATTVKVKQVRENKCENCGTKDSYEFSKYHDDKIRCGTCVNYLRAHGKEMPRELHVVKESQSKVCANCGTTDAQGYRNSEKGCLCRSCDSYWKRYHKDKPLGPPPAKKCENCGTQETSRWRRGENKQQLCNTCGQHWSKFKKNRVVKV
jgi:hypothetical protein